MKYGNYSFVLQFNNFEMSYRKMVQVNIESMKLLIIALNNNITFSI